MNVRLRRIPFLPLMAAGAVTGFVAGFFIGCVLGALLAWFSGAVLDWHRQLGFTLGVTESLLPLGDQIGLLQTINDLWWLVVPAAGVALGILNAVVGALVGGLASGVFNRFSSGVWLEVDVARRDESHDPSPLAGEEVRPRTGGGVARGSELSVQATPRRPLGRPPPPRGGRDHGP